MNATKRQTLQQEHDSAESAKQKKVSPKQPKVSSRKRSNLKGKLQMLRKIARLTVIGFAIYGGYTFISKPAVKPVVNAIVVKPTVKLVEIASAAGSAAWKEI